MQSKTQVCRYYQRGTCQYGARCKFLHEIPKQPSKPVNPFGFGTAQQQQQPASVQPPKNPFAFGPQNSQSHQQPPPNPFGFGVKGNNASSKPFENKWSRVSANQTATTSSRQADGQLPAATHSCTDPDTCKRQIAEDFQQERPLWKLTCYGHQKCAPCDITGDVSYEELRLSAYDDAKSGMSLPSIVEKERQLLNAKLVEFESLLRNPYKGPAVSVTSQIPFPQASTNAFSSIANNAVSPSTWTFGQSASSLNIGPAINATSSPPNTGYKHAGIFQNSGPSPSPTIFGTQNSPFAGLSSHSAQATTSPFQVSKPSFPSSFVSAPSATTLHPSNSIFSSSAVQTGTSLASQEAVQPKTGSFVNDTQTSDVSVDDKIWLKEKWLPGEIPETPPPERFVY